VSKSEITELAKGFAAPIRDELAQLDKLRERIDHLQRRVTMLEIQQRGYAAREMVRAHEEIADD
jgi:hypothetical protein